MTDAGLKELKDLKALTMLYLGTYVKELYLGTYFKKLRLGGTLVSEAGVNNLQQALPNCRIIHWP